MSNRLLQHRRTRKKDRIFHLSSFICHLLVLAILTGILGFAALSQKTLIAAVLPTGNPSASATTLTCDWNRTLFPPNVLNRPDVDAWVARYHATVKEIVDADLAWTPPDSCMAAAAGAPTTALKNLAAQISPWRDSAASFATLKESQIGPVLLEYLRLYECALKTAQASLSTDVVQSIGAGATNPVTSAAFTIESARKNTIIAGERKTARLVLHRTLVAISGMQRLRPLAGSLSCIERASLDLRNVLSLAAEASTCLIRASDARGSLRTLPTTYP